MKSGNRSQKIFLFTFLLGFCPILTIAQVERHKKASSAADSTRILKRIFVSDTVPYIKKHPRPKQPRVEIKPTVILVPPSLQIISIEPTTPVAGQSLTINFRFDNDDILKKPRTGFFQARVSNTTQTISVKSDRYPIQELPPGQSTSGKVTITKLNFEKQGLIELEYYDTYSSFYHPYYKKIISQSVLLSSTERDLIVSILFIDVDSDGINDRQEAWLLEKFKPYYKFSKHYGAVDDYRPTDVIWFLHRSEVLTTEDESAPPIIDNQKLSSMPESLLFTTGVAPWITEIGSSDLTVNHRATQYHVNPITNVPNISEENPGRHGPSWNEVMSRKNVGLYGHVVPIKLNSPSDYDRKHRTMTTGTEKEFIKVEYWQFFGYNECHCGAFDHEGDWITIQVLFDPRGENPDSIASVYYYIHGALEIRFDMNSSQGPIPVALDGSNDAFVEFHGPNYGNHCHADALSIQDTDCSYNTMRFSQDPVTSLFTHPVVYIENGAHEPWPTSSGFFVGVPNHDGNDNEHSYLTNTPPNLGEVDAALDVPGALQILRFNGNWGAQNGGARGPTLHWQWTWPENSATRKLIADVQFTD